MQMPEIPRLLFGTIEKPSAVKMPEFTEHRSHSFRKLRLVKPSFL